MWTDIIYFLRGREEEIVTCLDLQNLLENEVGSTAQDKRNHGWRLKPLSTKSSGRLQSLQGKLCDIPHWLFFFFVCIAKWNKQKAIQILPWQWKGPISFFPSALNRLTNTVNPYTDRHPLIFPVVTGTQIWALFIHLTKSENSFYFVRCNIDATRDFATSVLTKYGF